MYHPVSHSGVSEEQWQELVKQHTNDVRDWLWGLQQFVASGQGNVTDHLGGSLLDHPPEYVFNMAIAGDRESAAVWVEYANATAIAWTVDNNIELPGSAVFDVGPGGAPGESWHIRDMEMFDDVPALGLFKLAGGALLVIPRPWQEAARRLEGGLFDEEELTEREDETAEDENAEDLAAEEEWHESLRRVRGDIFALSAIDREHDARFLEGGLFALPVIDEEQAAEDEAAGNEPARNDTAEDSTARDETAEDKIAGDQTAGDEIAKLDIHEVNAHIVAGEQTAGVHPDAHSTGKDRVDARDLLKPAPAWMWL
jgi:hypothetical protein